MEKTFCFTIDDNIRFLKELNESGGGLFTHPYSAMLKRLHGRFGLKIQLNMFYRCEGFTLSDMSNSLKSEFDGCYDWLKISFHSERENDYPYAGSDYGEILRDCEKVQNEIKRFASEKSLAKTTTVHFCQTTQSGLQALKDCGVKGLLGLFDEQTSYGLSEEEASGIRLGKPLEKDGIVYAAIDAVMNLYGQDELLERIKKINTREHVNVMIHEQYFYPDYPAFQPDFEDKISKVFELFENTGRKSVFFEEII